jgi:hypothetical protein
LTSHVLFEIASEASARQIAEALVAAEARQPEAWRDLDAATLQRLRSDASTLAALVPYALLCLAEQLARHPRPSVRLDAIRLLRMVRDQDPDRVDGALRQLAADRSRGVARAAEMLLAR